MGVTIFMDRTQEEFKKLLAFKQPSELYPGVSAMPNKYTFDKNIKSSDHKHFCNEPKDQGSCGSCWAFAAVAPLECEVNAQMSLEGSKRINLSEQQFNDCDWPFGSEGCNGGWMSSAYEYGINRDLCTEEEYPYKGVD